MATDFELLKIELDTLWLRDDRGRLLTDREPNGRVAPFLVIASSHDGRIVEIGSRVPDALAAELRAAGLSDPPSDPSVPPAGMPRCAQLLEAAVGPVETSSGPCYVIPSAPTFTSAAAIRRSNDAVIEGLRHMNPPRANWSGEEWNSLVDGALGPWVMATVDAQVIAICHSARLTQRGAEAGVWTDPDHRGQGHAAAVTAAWASLLAGSGRCLFYSTSSTNTSSQRVAARLNLRPIGWTWQLASPRT